MDFANTVVVMTSNVGAKAITDGRLPLGFAGGSESGENLLREQVRQELRSTFKPEFLNRVDEIIVFRRLDERDMLAITYRLLDEVEKRFESLGLRLVVPEDAARRLAGMGRSENSGARPLRRTIRREIVDRAAQLLLEGALRSGDVVTAVCEEGGIELRKG